MPNRKKTLCIVVPTRNRVDTLKHCVRTLLEIEDDSVTFLISDNSENDETYEFASEIDDCRIKYVRTPSLLSMTESWNFAFKHADCDFITYIGDDDGVFVPGIYRLLKAIRDTDYQAFKWSTSEYQWPIDETRSKLISLISPLDQNFHSDLASQAKDVMNAGGWRYYNLPGIYHGAVSREILQLVADSNSGKLFNTTQPDLFLAVSIPNFLDNFLRLGVPATIQGRSAKSNGGSSVAKNGKKNIAQYMKEFGKYKLDDYAATLPGEMAWFMEPFIFASKSYAFYKKSPINISAMWAFGVRIGFIGFWETVIKTRMLKSQGPFQISQFLAWSAIHFAAKARRIFLNLTLSKDNTIEIGDTIYEFSKYLEDVHKDQLEENT